MQKSHLYRSLTVFLLWVSGASIASGQSASPTTRPGAQAIDLNFPPDIELRVVVDYVAKRLNLNILYDERIDGKKLTLAAPARVTAESLPDLLASVLRLKGFALVEAGAPGWKRIIPIGEPAGDVQVAAVAARNVDAGELAQDVRRLLASRTKADAGSVADVSADPRANQVMIVGSAAQVTAAKAVIQLIDVPAARGETPVRFYKLANTTAADVLETIRSVDEDRRPAGGGGGNGGADATSPLAPGAASPGRSGTPASTRQPSGSGNQSRLSGGTGSGASGTGSLAGGITGSSGLNTGSALGAGGGVGIGTGLAGAGGNGAGLSSNTGSPAGTSGATETRGAGAATPSGGSSPEAVHSRIATVAADANTNSIIVVGPPAAQRLYENLIRQLDRRRPQVLVESTLVTLDTSHDFSFGVEIAGRRNGTDTRRFVFSSFGLSQVDATTGQLSVLPGLGLNGAVLSPDIADVIIRALQADTHSKIVASPRVLVNDNATGTLSSVAGSPVTSINANNTISTTSFAGYAEAGTEILLTPHISEKDYLQLEYEVTLSSFTGQSSNGIPPPIQKNTVSSQVTIPDGSTIIVGGLNRAESGNTRNAIPFLGDLPLVGVLFRSRTESSRNTTLFVFLRPIILRDEEFEDLRFLSERDVNRAGLPDGFPASEPMLVQ